MEFKKWPNLTDSRLVYLYHGIYFMLNFAQTSALYEKIQPKSYFCFEEIRGSFPLISRKLSQKKKCIKIYSSLFNFWRKKKWICRQLYSLFYIWTFFFKGTSNNDNPLYITMQIKPGTANGLAQRYHIMACNETRKSVCSQLPSVCVHTCQSAKESSIPFVSHNESTIAMTMNGLQSP